MRKKLCANANNVYFYTENWNKTVKVLCKHMHSERMFRLKISSRSKSIFLFVLPLLVTWFDLRNHISFLICLLPLEKNHNKYSIESYRFGSASTRLQAILIGEVFVILTRSCLNDIFPIYHFAFWKWIFYSNECLFSRIVWCSDGGGKKSRNLEQS